MLEHGGRLRKAAIEYGIAEADWLDLSSGLAPWPWPIPEIPLRAWARLPETDDGLEKAASDYYGAGPLLPVPGSQAAIQLLPRLRRSADRPGADLLGQQLEQLALGQHKAQPHPGQAEEFAERAQHDQADLVSLARQAQLRGDVHERFVDHQPTAALGQPRMPVQQALRGQAQAGGIVGVDHH